MVGIGSHTSLVLGAVPAIANAGEQVSVTFEVKNIYTSQLHIAVKAWIGDKSWEPFLSIANTQTWADPGETVSFNGEFTMPDNDTILKIYTYWESVDGWVDDDSDEFDIILAEEYRGSLSRKELEYDGDRAGIPVI